MRKAGWWTSETVGFCWCFVTAVCSAVLQLLHEADRAEGGCFQHGYRGPSGGLRQPRRTRPRNGDPVQGQQPPSHRLPLYWTQLVSWVSWDLHKQGGGSGLGEHGGRVHGWRMRWVAAVDSLIIWHVVFDLAKVVQIISLTDWVTRGTWTDDSAEILFQSFHGNPF